MITQPVTVSLQVGQKVNCHSNPQDIANGTCAIPSDFNMVAVDPTICSMTDLAAGTVPGDCLILASKVGTTVVNITGTGSTGVLVTTPITVVVTAAPVPTAGVLDHFAPTFDTPVAQ